MNAIKKRHRAPTMYGLWVPFLRRFLLGEGDTYYTRCTCFLMKYSIYQSSLSSGKYPRIKLGLEKLNGIFCISCHDIQ